MRTAEPLSEQVVSRYLTTVRTVLTKDVTVLSESERHALESLLLGYVNRTTHVSDLIDALVFYNTSIPAFSYHGDQKHALPDFLYTRAAPELLLGGYTPSVMMPDLLLVETLTDEVSDRFTPYTQIREQSDVAELVQSFRQSRMLNTQMFIEAGVSGDRLHGE